MKNQKSLVISLGGSLVSTDNGVDWRFLKQFKELILKKAGGGFKIYLTVGGGRICRHYQETAGKIVRAKKEELDWLGIHASRLNGYLVRLIFGDKAHPEVIKNPAIPLLTGKKIVVAGGWKPGWSTNYVAVMIAQEYKIKTIINLSNIDYVYNKDPHKYRDAKKFARLSWKEFSRISSHVWQPGLNTPFDPIAARQAAKLGLKVITMNGHNLLNLKNYFSGRKFRGTEIEG